MRGFEAFSDLEEERNRLVQRNGLPPDEVSQVLALGHLHDEAGVTLTLKAMNCGDVWMIERREGFRFPLEPFQALVVFRERD